MTNSTKIIAEAGVNHNGSLSMALELVDIAAAAGADYVKFQTFKAKNLANINAKKAPYQTRTTNQNESQFDMLSRLELSIDDHFEIQKRCVDKGINFLSTPFDLDSLSLLTKHFNLSEIKLGSGELTNGPLLLAAGQARVKIILSTGMGTLAEVEQALGVIAFGMCRKGSPKGRTDFANVLVEKEIWPILSEQVTLMHCTTDYPAAAEETNLKAMNTLRQAFGLKVGYSDHTSGEVISLAAVALGANVIEKHFTLDRSLPGPDHAASLEPKELNSLVQNIRIVESAIGSGIKQPSPTEIANQNTIRKSLMAAYDLPKNHKLKPEDISVKRPGDGISPMEFWEKINTITKRPVSQDEFL
jgi:N-acetylneuraminate synthase